MIAKIIRYWLIQILFLDIRQTKSILRNDIVIFDVNVFHFYNLSFKYPNSDRGLFDANH